MNTDRLYDEYFAVVQLQDAVIKQESCVDQEVGTGIEPVNQRRQ